MRIIAGRYRGTRLAPLGAGDPAARLRPTPDRVREAVFSILAARPGGDPVPGARVLDLFAGTGALGLEALSRGAVHAGFVDDGPAAQALLRQNIARLRAQDVTAVWRRDATRLGPNPGAPYGLVFLDPPYRSGLGAAALAAAAAGGWLAPGATVVWEEAEPQAPPPGFVRRDARRWGDSWVTFLDAPDREAADREA
jgi:16S rRNA (guanine966-N2)-methyltransferase